MFKILQVIRDIFKSISTIVGFSGTSIDEPSWKEYYCVLQAMGLSSKLRIGSPFEDVTEVWMNNESMIQECKSISFAGEDIAKLPYNALNEMRGLTELNISSNKFLTIDPEKFTTLQKRLTVINLSSCKMSSETFNAIINCKCLEKLNFDNTSLKGILDSDNYSWGNLKKTLTELNILWSGLTVEALDRVSELESLRILNATGNELGDLSNWLGFENLSNLTELRLFYSQLTSIPDHIGDLSNLTELHLSRNRLTSLPDSIGNLANLTKLNLSFNQLASIPESIGDLKNLTELYLPSNRLTSIPESIGNLKNLITLRLPSNRLTSIPESIGNLSKLTWLNLYSNRLTSVPNTIMNLRNTLGGYVDIRYNDGIVQYGDSEANLGLEQLIEVFGNRLWYTEPIIISMTVEEAYKKRMRMPIHWNFDRLRQLRVTPIPQIDMMMDEMMTIWKRLPKKGIDERSASDMTAFIRHIYKSDERYNGWSMAREYLQLSKNLLGSVLNILSTKSETDSELVESNINTICEGLKYCNDRKLSELRLAYYTLIDKLTNQDETLDSLINNIISNEKETMFDFTFIRYTSQSVHVQRYWKYRLRDEVGFDFDVNTGFGTHDQDPFNGHSGDALDAFYSKFTSEHAIEVLTIRINETENCTYMSELMGIIVNDNELTSEEKESMLVGEFTGITREGVKYYLLKQGLLIQNQE